MATDIRSKTSRAKLAVRHAPYWTRLEVGGSLGYRKKTAAEGVWCARWRDPVTEKRRETSLGRFAEFDEAAEAARKWFHSLGMGVSHKKVTVAEACALYVEHNRVAKSPANAKDAEGRFKRLVNGHPIGKKPLERLTKVDVSRWQLGLIDQVDNQKDEGEALRRAKDSANRNLATLKAALNHALAQGLVAGSVAWEGVKAFGGVSAGRKYFFPKEERLRLVAAAPPDFAMFLKALFLTGARPGELAKLNVEDFDKNLGTLRIPSGKTKARICTLSTDAVAFFNEATSGRPDNATLLPMAIPAVRRDFFVDDRWRKDRWKLQWRDSAKRVGIHEEAVLYATRHTAISEWIIGGVSVFEAAQWAGTSVPMIERHYGHLRLETTRAKLDTVRML
jgi:hypothetical protein